MEYYHSKKWQEIQFHLLLFSTNHGNYSLQTVTPPPPFRFCCVHRGCRGPLHRFGVGGGGWLRSFWSRFVTPWLGCFQNRRDLWRSSLFTSLLRLSLQVFGGKKRTRPYDPPVSSEPSGGAGGSSAVGDWTPPGPSAQRAEGERKLANYLWKIVESKMHKMKVSKREVWRRKTKRWELILSSSVNHKATSTQPCDVCVRESWFLNTRLYPISPCMCKHYVTSSMRPTLQQLCLDLLT